MAHWPSLTVHTWITCGDCGKRSYGSKSSAKATLRNQRRKLKRAGGYDMNNPLVVYRCRSGNGLFHIGHSFRTGGNTNDPLVRRIAWECTA